MPDLLSLLVFANIGHSWLASDDPHHAPRGVRAYISPDLHDSVLGTELKDFSRSPSVGSFSRTLVIRGLIQIILIRTVVRARTFLHHGVPRAAGAA